MAKESPYVSPWEEIMSHSQTCYLLMDKKGKTLVAASRGAESFLHEPPFAADTLSESHEETVRRLEELKGIPCVRIMQIKDRHYRLRYSYISEHLFIEGVDITELYLDTRHDVLTGLPNRGFFYEMLENAAALAKREGEKLGVFVMDLNGFKAVNDAYGHIFGDAFLVEVGRRLKHAVRGHDIIARAGGDEFYALGHGIKGTTDAGGFAKRILRAFEAPLLIFGQKITAEMSIGAAIGPLEGEIAFPDDFIKFADIALYHAKKNREAYHLYSRTRDGGKEGGDVEKEKS
ncbi:GGDEF domain-containing protein [Candidatus Parcubacteria bacterium]|nr:GGDEF domain-containing protein [Candidatus Parcubacteria bacterium]